MPCQYYKELMIRFGSLLKTITFYANVSNFYLLTSIKETNLISYEKNKEPFGVHQLREKILHP